MAIEPGSLKKGQRDYHALNDKGDKVVAKQSKKNRVPMIKTGFMTGLTATPERVPANHPDVYAYAQQHEEDANEHETLARAALREGKPSKAAKHREAADKHTLAAAYYRKAMSGSNSRHAQNHFDRAQEKTREAYEHEEKHNIEVGDDD